MIDSEFKKLLKQEINSASKVVKSYIHNLKSSQTSSMVNSKELNIKNYINLHGLERFIAKHKDISDEQIIDMIKINKSTFKFLNNYIEVVDEPLMELKQLGAMPALMTYNNRQIYEH